MNKNKSSFYIILSIIILFVTNINGQTKSLKFYPLALAVGKFQICHDIRFGYELKFNEHHNIEIGIQGSLPHIIGMGVTSILAIANFSEFDQVPYAGAGGFISYKYHFINRRLYLGAKLFSCFYYSLDNQNTKNGLTGRNGYDGPDEYYTKLLMNELTTKIGWINERKNNLDVSIEIGYRLNKGYMVFENTKIEMPHSLKQGQINYYSFLRFPLRLGIDLSININKRKKQKDFWFKE
jgi:hypothetical protein